MTTQAQTKSLWKLDPAHSSVEFSAKHLVISTVKGRFARMEVDLDVNEEAPERSLVEARIEVASISTNDETRDAHLRSPDFLDAENHPWLTFRSRRIERSDEERFNLVGDLTIRGVTREVVLDGTFSGIVKDPWGNQRAGFTAQTAIHRKDFGLTWNMALEAGGLVVGETVKISIDLELVREKGA